MIDEALATGYLELPEGPATHWRLVSSNAAAVREDERDHGERLIHS
jgi:hypothetical protein